MNEHSDFWSRRKAQVKAQEQAEADLLDAEVQLAEQAKLEEQTDEELLVQLNLPDPDDLKAGDDFSGFMAKAVPERLRRRALRKLWLTNPVFANLDGLVDYGEDFTDSATVLENMQTAYQVGKGMTQHVLEMLRQEEEAQAALEAETVPVDPSVSGDQPGMASLDDDQEDIAANLDEDLQSKPSPDDTDNIYVRPETDGEVDEMVVVPKPRRMKFKVEPTEVFVA